MALGLSVKHRFHREVLTEKRLAERVGTREAVTVGQKFFPVLVLVSQPQLFLPPDSIFGSFFSIHLDNQSSSSCLRLFVFN